MASMTLRRGASTWQQKTRLSPEARSPFPIMNSGQELKGEVIDGPDSKDMETAEPCGSSSNCSFPSVALLNVLAEVASQTLHSDPAFQGEQQETCVDFMTGGRSKGKMLPRKPSECDMLDLDQIRMLSDNHLVDIFAEFEGNEMKRMFSFTCFLVPDECQDKFSSFGSEWKARQKIKCHLQTHIFELIKERETTDAFSFTAETLQARRRRLTRAKGISKIRGRLAVSLPLKIKHGKENSDSSSSRKLRKDHRKLSLAEISNEQRMKFRQKLLDAGIEDQYTVKKKKPKYENNLDEDNNSSHSIKNEMYSFPALPSKEGNFVVLNDHNYSFAFGVTKVGYFSDDVVYEEQIEDVAPNEEKELKQLWKLVLMAAKCDEDKDIDRRCLNIACEVELPYEERVPETIIRSADLPVVRDNRKEEFLTHFHLVREFQPSDIIQRDEYKLMKKPKGKAKFIGQSKAEKEMALSMIESIKSKSTTLDSLECRICNPPRTFTAPTTLVSHYRSHAGIKPFECRQCPAVFTRQHSLNYHMLIHSNQTRFTCVDCGRKFRHPSHYKEHRRRHTGEAPFECSDCLFRFKTRNTYKRHLKTRHGKILTTTGGLIILSEEEFTKVRTFPKSELVHTVRKIERVSSFTDEDLDENEGSDGTDMST